MAESPSGTRAIARRQINETWQHIAEALLGVASARAVQFVSELVPGFRDQFDRSGHDQRAYDREPRAARASV